MKISKLADFVKATVEKMIPAGTGTSVTVMTAVLAMAMSQAQAQGLPHTEDFSADTLKDAATTADWDTASGVLRLPLTGSTSPVQSLNGALSPAATSTTIDPAVEDRTRAVAVGDLDGDSDPDLAFGNDGFNSVYFNDGTGGFARGDAIPDDFFAGGNTRSAAMEDFNGDGHLDVVFAEFGGQANRIHFNNGSGTTQVFTAGDFVDLGAPTLKGDSLATGDVDGDGDIDIVLGVDGGYVKLFRNDGFGNFAEEDVLDTERSATGFHARSVLLGDLDRDGDLDLVAAREYADARVYRNDGDGNFSNVPTQSAGSSSPDAQNNLNSPDSAALGDVDGDGYLDLIIGNDGSNVDLGQGPNSKPNRLYLNSGTASGIFPLVSFEFADLAYTNSARLADVDRDGDLDLITADSVAPNNGNPAEVPGPNRLYINDPAANAPNIFAATGTSITADVLVTKSLQVADLDGDGDLDMALANQQDDPVSPSTSGANQVVMNAGTLSGVNADQLFATAQSLTINLPGDNLASGMIVAPVDDSAEADRTFSYWLSDDGGISWIFAHAGMSVDFEDPTGADLRWRVEMNSLSPAVRPNMDSLTVLVSTRPRFTSTEITAATQGVLYTYPITTTDPDPGDVTEIRDGGNLPAWLTLTDNNDGTATLEGTPTNDDVGTIGNDVDIEIADTGGRTNNQTFTIDVANVNDAPTVIMPVGDIALNQGDMVNIDATPVFEDIDGDVLSYSIAGQPASISIDSVTGIVSGTLDANDVANSPFAVSITATDPGMESVSDNFMLTVNDIADAPRFDSAPVTAATEGQAYAYNVMTSDPDPGDVLTITAPTLPGWLTLTDNGDGTASLAGTPAAGDVGAANVVLRVTDTSGTFVEQPFAITVSAVAPPPPPPPPPPRRSSGGCTVGPSDGTIDPTLPLLILISVGYLLRRRLSPT